MFFDLEPYKKYIIYNDFIRADEKLKSLLINKNSIVGVGYFGDNSFGPNLIQILLPSETEIVLAFETPEEKEIGAILFQTLRNLK